MHIYKEIFWPPWYDLAFTSTCSSSTYFNKMYTHRDMQIQCLLIKKYFDLTFTSATHPWHKHVSCFCWWQVNTHDITRVSMETLNQLTALYIPQCTGAVSTSCQNLCIRNTCTLVPALKKHESGTNLTKHPTNLFGHLTAPLRQPLIQREDFLTKTGQSKEKRHQCIFTD